MFSVSIWRERGFDSARRENIASYGLTHKPKFLVSCRSLHELVRSHPSHLAHIRTAATA